MVKMMMVMVVVSGHDGYGDYSVSSEGNGHSGGGIVIVMVFI